MNHDDDSAIPRPTESEQDILRLLWAREPATVREIWEALQAERADAPGYTGALKRMQLMLEKGLVTREESGRAHLYRAARAPERTRQELVGNLMDRMFEGSASSLVLHALGAKKLSAKERAEIRALLSKI
jgi:BlaI family transcriptional regulator, penicillinase repressor